MRNLTADLLLLLLIWSCGSKHPNREEAPLPDIAVEQPLPERDSNSPFVVVTDLDPTILVDLRYCRADNFVGTPLDGYLQPVAILTRQAAQALVEVSHDLKADSLLIRIHDAYRPHRAVEHICRWAADPTDTATRSSYYPNISKQDIRWKGYISRRSKHSMGSTVDLTLVDARTGEELDMGTPIDYLDPRSNYSSPETTPEQRTNRQRLRKVMTRHGFSPIEAEWWHFTLRNQPYTQSFDFPVHADSAYAQQNPIPTK